MTLSFAPRTEGRVNRRVGAKIPRVCVRGIRQIQQDESPPPHFNEEALVAIQKLRRAAQRDGAEVRVLSNGEAASITSEGVERVQRLIERARIYIDYGTIEGLAEVASVHGELRVTVFESATNARVECNVGPHHFKEITSIMSDGRPPRVAVSGRVRYRNDKPASVKVDYVRFLRNSTELPQLEDLPPMNITDGIPSEEYVRRLRDAR